MGEGKSKEDAPFIKMGGKNKVDSFHLRKRGEGTGRNRKEQEGTGRNKGNPFPSWERGG
jgi:hypothetical protein